MRGAARSRDGKLFHRGMNTVNTTNIKPATTPLYKLAHARTGDKGDRSNISVIAYQPEFYPLLAEQLTEATVAALFADRKPQRVTRYLLPKLGAMNFVLDGVLNGGVNDSLNLDAHGKALAFLLLQATIDVPPHLQKFINSTIAGTSLPIIHP
jgi:hypothetical protein